jgi:hypothetical protein
MKSFITLFAASILFGDKSSASILQDISKASTISIPFFFIFSLTFEVFGFARMIIKFVSIANSSIIFTYNK